MSGKELKFYWMCKQIQLRNVNNPTPRDSYLPYKLDAVKFNLDILTLEALMPAELVIGKGYTLDQNVAKNSCSAYWDEEVCQIIKGFALKFGKNVFFQQVNFTISKLNGIKLPKYYGVIVNLNTACEAILLDPDYIAGSYAVTSGVLTGGMALANAFLSLTGEAGQVRSGKGVSGVEIKGALKVLQIDLTIMDKDIYGVANLTFRKQYQTDRKIDKSVIHNTVSVLAIDSITKVPINRVFIINEGAVKGDYTDIDGLKDLYKKSGTNILNFSHKDPKTKVVDYIPQTIRVTALYKKSVSLTVEMVKVIMTEMTENNLPAGKKKSKKTSKAITSAVADKTIEATKEPVAKKEVAVKEVRVVKKKK